MKKGFPYIVIVILVAVIIWLTKCSGETMVAKTDTQTSISYVHDTIKVKGKTKIGKGSIFFEVPFTYETRQTISL